MATRRRRVQINDKQPTAFIERILAENIGDIPLMLVDTDDPDSVRKYAEEGDGGGARARAVKLVRAAQGTVGPLSDLFAKIKLDDWKYDNVGRARLAEIQQSYRNLMPVAHLFEWTRGSGLAFDDLFNTTWRDLGENTMEIGKIFERVANEAPVDAFVAGWTSSFHAYIRMFHKTMLERVRDHVYAQEKWAAKYRRSGPAAAPLNLKTTEDLLYEMLGLTKPDDPVAAERLEPALLPQLLYNLTRSIEADFPTSRLKPVLKWLETMQMLMAKSSELFELAAGCINTVVLRLRAIMAETTFPDPAAVTLQLYALMHQLLHCYWRVTEQLSVIVNAASFGRSITAVLKEQMDRPPDKRDTVTLDALLTKIEQERQTQADLIELARGRMIDMRARHRDRWAATASFERFMFNVRDMSARAIEQRGLPLALVGLGQESVWRLAVWVFKGQLYDTAKDVFTPRNDMFKRARQKAHWFEKRFVRGLLKFTTFASTMMLNKQTAEMLVSDGSFGKTAGSVALNFLVPMVATTLPAIDVMRLQSIALAGGTFLTAAVAYSHNELKGYMTMTAPWNIMRAQFNEALDASTTLGQAAGMIRAAMVAYKMMLYAQAIGHFMYPLATSVSALRLGSIWQSLRPTADEQAERGARRPLAQTEFAIKKLEEMGVPRNIGRGLVPPVDDLDSVLLDEPPDEGFSSAAAFKAFFGDKPFKIATLALLSVGGAVYMGEIWNMMQTEEATQQTLLGLSLVTASEYLSPEGRFHAAVDYYADTTLDWVHQWFSEDDAINATAANGARINHANATNDPVVGAAVRVHTQTVNDTIVPTTSTVLAPVSQTRAGLSSWFHETANTVAKVTSEAVVNVVRDSVHGLVPEATVGDSTIKLAVAQTSGGFGTGFLTDVPSIAGYGPNTKFMDVWATRALSITTSEGRKDTYLMSGSAQVFVDAGLIETYVDEEGIVHAPITDAMAIGRFLMSPAGATAYVGTDPRMLDEYDTDFKVIMANLQDQMRLGLRVWEDIDSGKLSVDEGLDRLYGTKMTETLQWIDERTGKTVRIETEHRGSDGQVLTLVAPGSEEIDEDDDNIVLKSVSMRTGELDAIASHNVLTHMCGGALFQDPFIGGALEKLVLATREFSMTHDAKQAIERIRPAWMVVDTITGTLPTGEVAKTLWSLEFADLETAVQLIELVDKSGRLVAGAIAGLGTAHLWMGIGLAVGGGVVPALVIGGMMAYAEYAGYIHSWERRQSDVPMLERVQDDNLLAFEGMPMQYAVTGMRDTPAQLAPLEDVDTHLVFNERGLPVLAVGKRPSRRVEFNSMTGAQQRDYLSRTPFGGLMAVIEAITQGRVSVDPEWQAARTDGRIALPHQPAVGALPSASSNPRLMLDGLTFMGVDADMERVAFGAWMQ